MKKDRSKKRRKLPEDEPKRKGKSSSKMDEWREQWGEGDDDDENDQKDKLKEGKNTRRILPNKEPDEPWFEAFAMHYRMGPDESESFRCIEPGGPFGHSKKLDRKRNYRAKKCDGCKKYCKMKTKARAFEFGSKEGIAFWRKQVAPWRAKHQFLMATIRPKSKEDKNKVFVLQCGLQIAQPLMSAYYDEDGGGDFTDPVRGRNICIVKEKLSKREQDVKYTPTIQPDRIKLRNWKKLRKRLPDLKSFLPEELEPEAIQAILNGDGDDSDDEPRRKKKKGRDRGRDDDADDDVDDDVDDDDDDEEGSSRRLKTKKRRRGEDEEVDPDADEEDDDDEDEKPKKKKKKSKMRNKLARRAEQDDDDDDDDEEEDDEDLDDEDDEDDDDDD